MQATRSGACPEATTVPKRGEDVSQTNRRASRTRDNVELLLLRVLQQPLLTWVVNARTLLRHPMALTTIGAVYRRDLGPMRRRHGGTTARSATSHSTCASGIGCSSEAGGSMVWLVARGAEVTSVEHDPWVSKVRVRCPAAGVRAGPRECPRLFGRDRRVRGRQLRRRDRGRPVPGGMPPPGASKVRPVGCSCLTTPTCGISDRCATC